MLASEEKNASEKHDKRAIENGGSPPKPETVPVPVPLTVEDTVSLDTSCQRKPGTDDASMVVNIDDTQSELEGDTSIASSSAESKTKKESTSKNEDRKTSRAENKQKEASKEKSDKEAKDSTSKESEAKSTSKGKTRFVFNETMI